MLSKSKKEHHNQLKKLILVLKAVGKKIKTMATLFYMMEWSKRGRWGEKREEKSQTQKSQKENSEWKER